MTDDSDDAGAGAGIAVSAKVAAALGRLDAVLPLRARQGTLAADLRVAHRRLLRGLLETGRLVGPADDWCGERGHAATIDALVDASLVVRDAGGAIAGAYPFTLEPREHRVETVHGEVRAMCAIDALGIGPMFDLPAAVRSRCRVSGVPIEIGQDAAGCRVLSVEPLVYAGIDWGARRDDAPCAASLCTQMLFLAGRRARDAWRDERAGQREVFDLDEAAAFASALFLPLMREG